MSKCLDCLFFQFMFFLCICPIISPGMLDQNYACFPFDIYKGFGMFLNWLSQKQRSQPNHHLIYGVDWFLWCKYWIVANFKLANALQKVLNIYLWIPVSWYKPVQHTPGKSQITSKTIGLIYIHTVCEGAL